MDFGFSAVDFITLIQLANKIRKDFSSAPAQFKAISEEVRSLSIVLQDADILTERSLSRAQAVELSQVAGACTNLLEELQTTLEKYRILERRPTDLSGKLRKAWKRVAWEPDDVRELRSRVTSNITLLEALNGRIIRENTFKLVQNQDDAERKAILDWLTPTNYSSQHNDFIERREPGTGEWFLESQEYGDLVSRIEPTLFSPGIPGSGKTILASIVIDDLLNRYQSDPNVGIAYIYLNFRQQEVQKLPHLLSSLLKQLLYKRPTLPESIRELHDEHTVKGTRPSIAELSAALNAVAASYKSVFLVIDALDECRVADGCRQEFINQLLSLQMQKGVGSSLFVTSRFIPEITEHFDDCLTLHIRASDEDVQKYVDSNLSRLSRCVRDDKELQGEIKREIVKCVDGMFLLAQLHLDSLKGKKSRKAIRTALQNLPTGSEAYDYAYDEAMARIEGQLQDERDLAIEVLLWISSAMRPLKTTELEHAIAIEVGEACLDEDNLCPVEELVSVCAGLVTVDQESGIVRLVHFTTQQYFERTRGKWFADADLKITTSCVTYLLFDEFSNGPCPHLGDFQDRLQNQPLYDYAATSWGKHAKKCGVEGAEVTADIFEHPDHVDSMSQAMMASDFWPLHVEFADQFARGMTGLHLAAYFCFQEMAEYHLSRGVPPDIADGHDRTPLCWAAMKGDFDIVKLLVDTGKVDLLKRDNNTRTALSWASQGGFIDIIKLFIESDFNLDPDAADDYGWTSLCWASEYGHEEVVKLFLSLPNVNPSSLDKAGRTPLSWAAENSHIEVVRLLVEATGGADTDLPDENGWAPIARAADEGADEVIQYLIDVGGATADRRDPDGRTALSWASQYGHESTVRLLASRPDVQVSGPDAGGRTPLSWATQYGHYGIVKYLLEAAPEDGDLEDSSGWTPLAYAAEYGFVSIMELLLNEGKARPDARDDNERGPISWAAQNGHSEAVAMLLNRLDVDASAPDSEGQTPLWWAACCGHDAVISLLLESEIDNVDLQNVAGLTPLAIAAKGGFASSVDLLMRVEGVDVNSVDEDFKTPLSQAVRALSYDVVETLLGSPDVDVNRPDGAGNTPLHYAVRTSITSITELLLRAPGINPDARNELGRTALSFAASGPRGSDAVELLMATPGVDVCSRDNDGRTPLHWAVWGRQREMVDLMLASDRLPANIDDLCRDNSAFNAVQLAVLGGDDELAERLMKRGAMLPEDAFGLRGLFEGK